MPLITTRSYYNPVYGLTLNGTDQYGFHDASVPIIYAASIWVNPTNTITTASSPTSIIQTQNITGAPDYVESLLFGNMTGLLTNETIGIATFDPATNNRTGVQNFTFTAGTWYNIIINWTGSRYNIIIDGVTQTVVSSVGGHATQWDVTDSLTVGARRIYTGNDLFLDATITNLILFDTAALTGGEISTIYNAGQYGETSINGNQFGVYRFDDGTGSTAADTSGNGNDLTLVNSPSWI